MRESFISCSLSSLARPRFSVFLGMGAASLLFGCSSDPGSPSTPLRRGDTDFVSSAPVQSQGRSFADSVANGQVASGASPPSLGTSTEKPRSVEETDLYRLDGDRLYYLNGYRGLMVFDVSDVDHPKFLGRSPIYGTPVEMIVRGGVASVVVSDWYGSLDDGTPFHGSIVRGLDARDASNIRVLGEAQLGGYVRDTRVVGDVIYAVTEKYPWDSVWYGGLGTSSGGVATSGAASVQVTVSAVNIAGGSVKRADEYAVPGQGGIFYVTPSAVLLAHAVVGAPDANGYSPPSGQSQLSFVDISDPAGEIVPRGHVRFDGYIQGWGTDNGRWNLDFADGKTAHALACGQNYCGSGQPLVLASADFSDPDAPSLISRVEIPGNTWQPAVRFDAGRMYLSPSAGYYQAQGPGGYELPTPIQIYDILNPRAPRLRGTVSVSGQLFNFIPSGNRLFALGSQPSSTADSYGNSVALHYLDVTDPGAPQSLGTATFGQGWAWTPAAGTFKAFTKDDAQGLVVLPFSGYNYRDSSYNNGLQLIEFTDTSIKTSGTAKTRGWVERGIFVKNRLVSLSELSLAVIDYTDRAEPSVVSELTLARNVINVKPQADGTLAEISSDWWDNDQERSKLRILDAQNVEETTTDATLSELDIPGVNAQVFHNGALTYVVSQVKRDAACVDSSGTTLGGQCPVYHARVSVVDRSTKTPVLRGGLDLPERPHSYWGWGWGYWGCGVGDWYYGSQTLQVKGHVLAFQSWTPSGEPNNRMRQTLMTVDISNPDQPILGEATIIEDPSWWWGNLRAVNDQLYASHYEWVEPPNYQRQPYSPGSARYYLDRIDLGDAAHPKVTARINVPGILFGASERNPNLIYTMNYRWSEANRGYNELAVLLLEGDKAHLQGSVEIPGYVGNVFVRGETAYFTVQEWSEDQGSKLQLYQANLSDPSSPKLIHSTPNAGWGWLLAVEGDRAFVTSGWANAGLDVFKLSDDKPPAYESFVRVRGFYTGSLAREGNDVYLATGYWGTEHLKLQ